MRRAGPVILAVGALLLIVGGAGHHGVVWAAGVVLAAAGLAVLVGRRSLVAGIVLAAVVIGGLGVYPWLIARSETDGATHWAVRATGVYPFGLTVHGGRVLELDDGIVRLLDARTGRRLLGTSADRAQHALDGSLTVMKDDALVAYDRSGRRLWSRGGTYVTPLAAGGGTVVVGGCRSKDCRILGIDAAGRTRWSRNAAGRYYGLSSQFPPDTDQRPEQLPDLALISVPGGARDAHSALDPRDGRVLVRSHVGRYDTVAPGRVVLQTQGSGTECVVQAVGRAGRGAPSRTGCGLTVGLADRAYVGYGLSGLHAVDLRTGRSHDVGKVEPEWVAGGDRVFVRRSGDRLTAEDPATGRHLWSHEFSGERPPSVSVAGDLVTVVAEAHGLNPFLENKGDEVVVLDARTGRQRGSLRATTGIRGTVALGAGRVLAVDKHGAHRIIEG